MINGRQQYGLTSLAKFMVKEAWNNLTKGFWLYLDASELKANKKVLKDMSMTDYSTSACHLMT